MCNIYTSDYKNITKWRLLIEYTEHELILQNTAGELTGDTAMVSTLLTVVGQPKIPTSAGNGGFSRGLPAFPSIDSIRDCNRTSHISHIHISHKNKHYMYNNFTWIHFQNQTVLRKHFCSTKISDFLIKCQHDFIGIIKWIM